MSWGSDDSPSEGTCNEQAAMTGAGGLWKAAKKTTAEADEWERFSCLLSPNVSTWNLS